MSHPTPLKDPELWQEEILAAAMSMIDQQGLKGLNLSALARQLGIDSMALHNRYRGKPQIISLILDELKTILRDNLRSAREDTPDACERIRFLLDRHFVMLKQHPGIPRLIFSDHLGTRYPSQRVKVLGILMEYMEGIELIVREGQESGAIRAGVPSMVFARMYLGVLQASALLWYLSGGRIDPEQDKEAVWRVFEKALKPD